MEENLFLFELDNGLRGIHQQIDDADVSHFGITIKAGSRDELDDEMGLAHFIEHSIFKGTKKRKTFHILSRLDAVGGEINAYTTKEETCIYGSFLNVYYDRAIELIADILFDSVFPDVEIDKEKDVIIDEINSYLDNPSDLIFDDFEDLIFEGHPIGRNILGTEQSVNSFNRNSILKFIKRNYLVENTVFSSVGNIPLDKLRKLCFKYLNREFSKDILPERVGFNTYLKKDIRLKKDTHQVHCLIGTVAYDIHSDKRSGLILLNNVLGGLGLNSRLNLNIREKYGLTYSIESNYTSYSDTGLFSVYFNGEKKSTERIVKLIQKEFRVFREKKMGVNQLHQAKQQLKGHIALAQENRVGLMQALGKSLLYFNTVETNKEIFSRIDKITSEEILEIANEILIDDNMTTLIYE